MSELVYMSASKSAKIQSRVLITGVGVTSLVLGQPLTKAWHRVFYIRERLISLGSRGRVGSYDPLGARCSDRFAT